MANACVVYGARARAYVDAVTRALRRDGADVRDDVWVLDTKYYVAAVRARAADDDARRATTATRDDGRVRAVVLACASATEFERARAACARDAIDGVDARVVAYDGRASTATRARATDAGFEVVEVRLDDDDADAALDEDGDDDGDARGVRRTIAALEATMWDDVTLKPAGATSDLGEAMRAATGTTTWTRTSASLGDAADAMARAMAAGDDDALVRVAASYAASETREDARLEKLAEMLAGDASM